MSATVKEWLVAAVIASPPFLLYVLARNTGHLWWDVAFMAAMLVLCGLCLWENYLGWKEISE